MSEYTIEDLRGKYVKAGTPEYEIFMDACEDLGVEWVDNIGKPRDFHSMYACVFNDGLDQLSCDDPNEVLSEELEPFTLKHQWSPETNTLPMKDLSDEQYGKMRRAADSGAVVESLDSGIGEWYVPDSLLWACDSVYRIKPKSEREVFVDRYTEFFPHDIREAAAHSLGQMFDDGVKAPEVE